MPVCHLKKMHGFYVSHVCSQDFPNFPECWMILPHTILGYIGDDTIILPSYVGIIISHYKGVPIKQPVSCCVGQIPGVDISEAKHHEASSEFAGGWNNKSRGSQSSDGEMGDPWWVPGYHGGMEGFI